MEIDLSKTEVKITKNEKGYSIEATNIVDNIGIECSFNGSGATLEDAIKSLIDSSVSYTIFCYIV